ncbi:MerR family transcriptional regulator [Streptomyces sp. NPDC004111]|uniref:MerR family transcriptional regulator n=1 Tax=Streptomyces sp. NPDC004111 TaxID=3364690 RepID=UPI0036CE6353
MRIGELARATGCTPRALRHYEQAGLLTSERSANGYREYDAERSVVRVRNIRGLLDVGLTLDDVQAFGPCLDGDVLAAAPSAGALALARERLAVLDARIAAQTAAREKLARALGEASKAVAGAAGGPGHAGADSGDLAIPRAL